ncbi:hypothetical protein BC939DRAFT_522088 [Gamsiella multidivaricata]|uniref:uncharacterized protein n=1 Tax=Gamsiella multidivaricata TaxID=101098 RepID=UPI00221E3F60|nr:uncharacterized protein BC939DRAFT_522088 [Gamsiella multidivaricata]KAI7818500.1 hypothetical protein BC939DRAFT_522088 [Gamsiella multidivaricata]
MVSKTFIPAPSTTPQLAAFFEDVPVEEFTALRFFRFMKFKSDERQLASHRYKELYKHALSTCEPQALRNMVADWSSGKRERDKFWSDLKAAEDREARLSEHISSIESDVMERGEIVTAVPRFVRRPGSPTPVPLEQAHIADSVHDSRSRAVLPPGPSTEAQEVGGACAAVEGISQKKRLHGSVERWNHGFYDRFQVSESLAQEEFDVAMKDFPEITEDFPELHELKQLLKDDSEYDFDDFMNKLCNLAPNTPVRRFVQGALSSFANYFPRHDIVPDIEEKQGTFDLVCPFVRGALNPFVIESRISEIAIAGNGERKNGSKDYSEKMEKCRRADLTAEDTEGNQIFLGECSAPYEDDKRKLHEDKWKLGRSLKDSWESICRQIVDRKQRPHGDLSLFGVQFFGETLLFMKFDFRGSFRLWEVESCTIPCRKDAFVRKFGSCCKSSLRFVHAVAQEIEQRKSLTFLTAKEKMILARAVRKFEPTTNTPPFKKTYVQ